MNINYDKNDTTNIDLTKTFKFPNKLLNSDSFEIEILSQLCRLQTKDGMYFGSVSSLLYYSNITLDSSYRNKTRAKQFLTSLGADIVDKENFSIVVDAFYEHNEFFQPIRYIQVPYDSYKFIRDINLYKYYLFMLRNIDIAKASNNSVYRNSLENISDSIGFTKNTIVKYNQSLMEYGLIYYVNSGDLKSRHEDSFISSVNFYSTDKSKCEQELDKWLNINKENYHISQNATEKEITSSMLKSANAIIRHHGHKDILTHEQYDKLMNAYNIIANNIQIDYISSKNKDAKIKALMDRTKGGNYELSYENAKLILEGTIKIRDCYNDYEDEESEY